MISVIVPVYNVESYLRRCIDSLLGQETDQEYEILLVDDGSTDQSGLICNDYRKKNPEKISVFHKENGGLSSARNFGIAHSNGDYLTFVDSDDYVSKTYLKDMFFLIQKYNADMAITKVVLRHTDEVRLRDSFIDFAVDGKEALYEVYCGSRISWHAYGKLYKRDIFLDNFFPDGYYEDQASLYKFLSRCSKIAIGDFRNNYYYVQRDGSISFSKFQDKHLRIFEICDEFSEYVNKTYPDMSFIVTMTYQKSVQLLLNRLSMSIDDYNRIFYKYREMFRQNALSILKNHRIPGKSKIYYVVLCTTPMIYRLFSKSIRSARMH